MPFSPSGIDNFNPYPILYNFIKEGNTHKFDHLFPNNLPISLPPKEALRCFWLYGIQRPHCSRQVSVMPFHSCPLEALLYSESQAQSWSPVDLAQFLQFPLKRHRHSLLLCIWSPSSLIFFFIIYYCTFPFFHVHNCFLLLQSTLPSVY